MCSAPGALGTHVVPAYLLSTNLWRYSQPSEQSLPQRDFDPSPLQSSPVPPPSTVLRFPPVWSVVAHTYHLHSVAARLFV